MTARFLSESGLSVLFTVVQPSHAMLKLQFVESKQHCVGLQYITFSSEIRS